MTAIDGWLCALHHPTLCRPMAWWRSIICMWTCLWTSGGTAWIPPTGSVEVSLARDTGLSRCHNLSRGAVSFKTDSKPVNATAASEWYFNVHKRKDKWAGHVMVRGAQLWTTPQLTPTAAAVELEWVVDAWCRKHGEWGAVSRMLSLGTGSPVVERRRAAERVCVERATAAGGRRGGRGWDGGGTCGCGTVALSSSSSAGE